MEIVERIEKDLKLFEANIEEIDNVDVKEMATRYYDDAKYYFEQGDLVTAFGCIAYAHGLIDTLRNFK